MRGLIRRARFLALFSPLVIVAVFVAGYFVLAGDQDFDPYRYVEADPSNPSLPGAQGVYVSTPRGFLKLLPFDEFDPDPPRELIPRITEEEAGPVVVYRRVLEPLERYKLFDLTHGREVAAERGVLPETSAVQLSPVEGAWSAATYGVSMPREGLAAGSDWFYFVVE